MKTKKPTQRSRRTRDALRGPQQRMVRAHSGDCTIYSAMLNGRPEDGICTCGYGLKMADNGIWAEKYSLERWASLRPNADIRDRAT